MGLKHFFSFVILSLFLVACIEVRDKEDQKFENDFHRNSESSGSLTISEPMYVYDGRILTYPHLIEEIQISAVRNKEVKSDVEFNFRELIFVENGKLFTLGNNLRVSVESLVSDSGLIATFPEKQFAHLGQDGRAGGHLSLKVEKAKGFLKIRMSGESGGEGSPGLPPNESMNGKPGRNGRNGDSSCYPKLAAQRGEVGQQGSQGYPGGAGGNGGSSGTLEFKLNDHAEFSFSIERLPGSGGLGGVGGKGGQGGVHGEDGIIHPNCPGQLWPIFIDMSSSSQKNKYGPDGPMGTSGQRGKDGAVQVYCLEINKVMNCM